MPISDVSELARLLDAHQAAEHRLKRAGQWKALAAALLTLLGSFGGAVWTVRGYLETLATKEQLRVLVEGQQAQIRDLGNSNAELAKQVHTCTDRNGFQDERLTELRSDVKELQSHSGILIRR